MQLSLPVSIGEGLDKLTILELKLKYIENEERKKEVKKEFDNIFPLLCEYKQKCSLYYNVLHNCNEKIWILCDQTRDKNNIDYGANCEKIIHENDKRFRIKNKINNILNSNLKEQKGYNKKKAFVLTHLGMGDMIVMNGCIRYLSIIYDEIVILCKDIYYENALMMYKDDKNIQIISIHSYNDHIYAYQNFLDHSTKGYDMFSCGIFKNTLRGKYNEISVDKITPTNPRSIHKWFYDDLDINISVMKDYFYLDNFKESEDLFRSLIIKDYIFFHSKASNRDISLDLSEFKDQLIINPDKNLYNPGEKFYGIAQIFVNKPIFYYIELMKNAKELHLVDSSFSCLAALTCKNVNQKRFLYIRDENKYPELFDESWVIKFNVF